MKFEMTKMTALAVAVSLLAGCTTPVTYKVEKDQKVLATQVGDLSASAHAPEQIEYITKSNDVFFAGKSFAIKQDELPAVFKKQITLVRDLDGMQSLVDRIAMLTGMRINYMRNATSSPSAQSSMSPMMGAANAMAGMQANMSYTLNYQGTVEGLLNFLTTKYGYYWRYKDGVVSLFETDTRVFELLPMPGATALASSVGLTSTSSGEQDGEGASQSTSSMAKSSVTSDAAFDFWDKVEKTVKPMMTPKGEIAPSPATGMLVVTDTPDALDKIAAYVDAQNRFLSRQVSISVKVISVENNDSDNYGINWDAVRTTLNNKYNLKLNTGFSLGSVPTMTLDMVSGRFSGTQALIGALSEKHKVHAVTSASAVTLNNHPVPITVGTQRAYLKSMTTTTDGTTGARSYTLEPGTVRYGTTMNFVPKVLADNTVLLQFGIDMTDVKGDFKVFGPENNQVQQPELDSKTFLQRASLKSGETLILAGYEDSKGMSDRTGTGSADLPTLGGQIKGNSGKRTLVIMIQPIVMDANK